MAFPRFRVNERQALLWILGASLVGYAASFIVAGFRQQGRPPEPSRLPRVRWMRPQSKLPTADYHYLLADLFDPSLMSLPSVHGYSWALWNHSPVARPPENEWTPTPAFLPTAAPRRLQPLLNQPTLVECVQTNAEKSPATGLEASELKTAVPTPARTHSALLVNGALADRPLVTTPELPRIPSPTALRPTAIRLAVRLDGTVHHVLLERSSGSAVADTQALALAPQLRFQVLDRRDQRPGDLQEELTWGVVKFAWAVTPP